MPYCVHCGSQVQPSDNFCEDCGKAAVLPDRRSYRRAEQKAQNSAERQQERHAAEEYYRGVGSRHPHIWPVTGAGRALFLICIGAVGMFTFVAAGSISEIASKPAWQSVLAAAAAAATWFLLTVIRYTLFPEVRPHNNPEMMGQKGDFWVFLIGIPLIILAIIGWLSK
jgi:hypothetical protein